MTINVVPFVAFRLLAFVEEALTGQPTTVQSVCLEDNLDTLFWASSATSPLQTAILTADSYIEADHY